MSRVPRIIPWLAVAAAGEWLVARTLTRSAIFMPKSPPVVAVYQALTWGGQFAFTLSGLLALGALAWLIWEAGRAGRFLLSSSLAVLLALSVVSLVIPPAGVILAGYHLLVLLVVFLVGNSIWQRAETWSLRMARMIPATAVFVGGMYQLAGGLYATIPFAGSPPFGAALFNLGEALVVAAGVAYFWIARASRPAAWTWGAAALPALAFSVLYVFNPAMTGIIAIWSTGLTLYLPWPLYAISLWLAGAGALRLLRARDPSGWAILLLAAGGYPPQLSSQVILGIVALSLLAAPTGTTEEAATALNETPGLPMRIVST